MSSFPDMLYELAVSARKPRWWADKLRREARELERSSTQNESIVQPGIEVEHISANTGFFGDLPIESCRIRLATNAPQTIPNATYTAVNWDTVPETLWPQQFGLDYDVANQAIDMTSLGNDSKFMMWYHIQWTGHATGFREVEAYDPVGDTRQFLWTRQDAFDTGAMPQSDIYWWGVAGWSPDIMSIRLYQNSGGDLALDWARFGIFRVR